MGKKVKRLIEQFKPENYNLEIAVDTDKLTFKGSVLITGAKTGRPSQRITFHQKDLKFSSAVIENHSKDQAHKIEVSRINNQAKLNEVRLHTDELLYPGNYTVTLEFSGKIAENMTGLYPCNFEHESKKKQLFATQFEPHHARELFPCVDEPEAKATFDLTLDAPKDLQALSNMPEKNKEITGKRQIINFQTTPIMSSYLLAFVVGEIHCVEATSKNGTIMRTWGHVGQPKKFLEYANQEAVKVIDFFEDYFHTPFPLEKCDQIALPDFEMGAMENWGLVTYREIALLADPDNRSVSSEQYISMVIAHELSHQWFGNLVTMKWWDDLWLNESFASIMEHVVLNKLHPDWHQWEEYTSSDVIACSNRDIYKDVQSVRVDVSHPDEIHALFDGAIVYAKGGRLLKMLMEYIGEESFRTGLKEYFKKHAYQNTTKDDLWRALSESSQTDVNALMDPWLEQSGMPLIRVSKKDDSIELTQERFVLDSQNDASLWPVPLLASQKLTPDILTKKQDKVRVGNKLPIFNVNGSGHYFVAYEDESYQKEVIDSLASRSVGAEARINIINDMLLLARRGDKSIVDALAIAGAMKDEPRSAVWDMIGRILGSANMFAEEDEALEASLKKLKRELAKDWYTKLGWSEEQSEDPNTKLLRRIVIGLMIGGEDKDAINHALSVYKLTPLEELPAEQRSIVLSTAVRHGGSKDIINELIKTYKKSANPDIKLSITAALTHTKDPEVAKQIFKEGLCKDGFVRPQDMFHWFAYYMRNRYTREVAWQWLVDEWDRLERDFGGGKAIDGLVIYSAGPLHTAQWQKRFEEFFEPKQDIIALTRKIKVALSEIDARVAWHNRDLPKIKKYFS